jgi:prophage antirepressor-like protein
MSHLSECPTRENHQHGAHGEIIPFDFGKLTLTTIVDGNGNPWWVAKEVCDVLGYKNSRGAVQNTVKARKFSNVPKWYFFRTIHRLFRDRYTTRYHPYSNPQTLIGIAK